MNRPLLFYSQWPLDYFNPEAKRKAAALSSAGYDVLYVAGVGLRNPRLSSAAKALDRTRRKVRGERGGSATEVPFREAVIMVAPPRQLRAMRRLNTAWVRRQVRQSIPRWNEAIAWVRWPTPELVDAIAEDPPAAIVYECVDPYEVSPGVTGKWAPIFAAAERQLVQLADLVVTPAEALGERFHASAKQVSVIPHGVDLELFACRNHHQRRERVEIGFAGTLDYRLDIDVLRAVAMADPSWTVRLIGPVQEGFDPSRFSDLENVTVDGPMPQDRVAGLVSDFDVGILPYVRKAPHYLYEYTDPIKASELLAAGRPVVARRNRALDRMSPEIYFADSPEEFVAQTRRAIAEDSAERSKVRRALVEDGTWEARLREIQESATALAPARL